MADLTLPIAGLILLTGYMFKDRRKESYENIYHSNRINKGHEELLKKSMQNHIDARNPTFTGVYDPILNVVGKNPVNVDKDADLSAKLTNNYDNMRINAPGMVDVKTPEKRLTELKQLSEGEFYTFKTGTVQESTKYTDDEGHSNMVPFFKGNIPEINTEHFTNQRYLVNNTGADIHIDKKEVETFYDGSAQDIYGVMYTANVEKDRYIPSRFKQGEKLFQDVRLAKPKMGIYRDTLVDKTPTIDDLRVNKQITHKGKIVPGNNSTETQRGILGSTSKNAPVTYYAQNEDMLFRGPGSIVAHKMDEQVTAKYTNKSDSIEYFGHSNSANVKQTDRDGEYRDPMKRENEQTPLKNTLTTGTQQHGSYGFDSSIGYTTQRETTSTPHSLNAHKSDINTKIRPLDLPKTTLREIMDKVDTSGNISSIYNKNTTDILHSEDYDNNMKTTTKEMNIVNGYIGNQHKSNSMGYLVSNYDNKVTLRQLMDEIEYVPGGQNVNYHTGKDSLGQSRLRNVAQASHINAGSAPEEIPTAKILGDVTRLDSDDTRVNNASGNRIRPEYLDVQFEDNPYIIR
jgi:hypothetical protein